MPRLLRKERRTLIVGHGLFGETWSSAPVLVSEVEADGAIALSRTMKPDVVFLDASVTDDVPRLVAAIREVSSDSSVIVVGEAQSDGDLASAIAAGATGFIAGHDPMLPLLGTLIGATPPLGACA